jgi:hypothetical protein
MAFPSSAGAGGTGLRCQIRSDPRLSRYDEVQRASAAQEIGIAGRCSQCEDHSRSGGRRRPARWPRIAAAITSPGAHGQRVPSSTGPSTASSANRKRPRSTINTALNASMMSGGQDWQAASPSLHSSLTASQSITVSQACRNGAGLLAPGPPNEASGRAQRCGRRRRQPPFAVDPQAASSTSANTRAATAWHR